MIKRQRYVYPTREILHKWAHQTQESARNPQGNLFFKGATIYSYRDSWPLARIYTRHDGKRLVLANCERYSVTTLRHQSAVTRAASHMPQCDVPMVETSMYESREMHDVNLKRMYAQIDKMLSEARRVLRVCNSDYRYKHARDLQSAIERYTAFFRIRRKVRAFPAAEFDAALARATAIESPDPIRDAKRYAKRARLQAEFDKYCAAVIEYNATDPAGVWRASGEWPRNKPYVDRKQKRKFQNAEFSIPEGIRSGFGSTLLRINGEQIETSQGARIPLDHAPRLWRLVQLVRERGTPYVHNGHTEHAGEYRINRIEVDGALVAGCHHIEYAELERMARTLGLAAA